MLSDPARISVAPLSAAVGDCELCMTAAADLRSAVVVHHSRGGAIQFIACDRCAKAMRRVAAAAGGQARFTTEASTPAVEVPASEASRRTPLPVGAPRLVQEYPERLRDADGTAYVARVYGQPRSDGTWTGWIEFVAVDTGRTRRTGQETTQSTPEDLAYWASGLEASYLEGAFARARPAGATAAT
jgi:hypothetical protein